MSSPFLQKMKFIAKIMGRIFENMAELVPDSNTVTKQDKVSKSQ